MTEAAPAAPPLAAAPAPATAEPWCGRIAWDLLDDGARRDLAVLFRFVAAVRAVADHPALAPERKEAALAALAAPFASPANDPGGASASATAGWAEPAAALAGLCTARGLDGRAAWRILQAAGQDLRKTRYRDWSELLTWCRFAAAPVGSLAAAILGMSADRARAAEAVAVAWQILDIVARAPSHYRWLGRVYLPERWFAEAQGDIADLGFQRRSPALRTVILRALDQASALAAEAEDVTGGLSGWRRRAAAKAMLMELAADMRALSRDSDHMQPATLGVFARRILKLRAIVGALKSRQ